MERNIDATRFRPETYPMILGGCYRASFREFLRENQYKIAHKLRCCRSSPLSTAGSTLILPEPNSRPSAPLKFIFDLVIVERQLRFPLSKSYPAGGG